MTWTAEDSLRLQEQHDILVGTRIVSFSADMTIGSLNVPTFNANIDRFAALGIRFTTRGFYPGGLNVRYVGFTATGPKKLMTQFEEWYRGFFRI